MVKAVFTIKRDSGYDDLPEQRCHFPLRQQHFPFGSSTDFAG
jgi:hypothetical protein